MTQVFGLLLVPGTNLKRLPSRVTTENEQFQSYLNIWIVLLYYFINYHYKYVLKYCLPHEGGLNVNSRILNNYIIIFILNIFLLGSDLILGSGEPGFERVVLLLPLDLERLDLGL